MNYEIWDTQIKIKLIFYVGEPLLEGHFRNVCRVTGWGCSIVKLKSKPLEYQLVVEKEFPFINTQRMIEYSKESIKYFIDKTAIPKEIRISIPSKFSSRFAYNESYYYGWSAESQDVGLENLYGSFNSFGVIIRRAKSDSILHVLSFSGDKKKDAFEDRKIGILEYLVSKKIAIYNQMSEFYICDASCDGLIDYSSINLDKFPYSY